MRKNIIEKNKRKFTKYVIHGAYYLPFLFPKWLRKTARNRSGCKSFKIITNDDNYIKYVSLMESKLDFTEFSINSIIKNSDVCKVKKWLFDNSVTLIESRVYSEECSNLALLHWKLGEFSINEVNDQFDFKEVYLKSEFISHVGVEIFPYGANLMVLSFVFYLKNNVNYFLNKIKVNSPEFDVELVSHNIYNKRNFGFKLINKEKVAIESLGVVYNYIFNDIYNAWEEVTSVIGLNINNRDSYAIADVSIKSKINYEFNYPYIEDYHFGPLSYKNGKSNLYCFFKDDSFNFDAIYSQGFYDKKVHKSKVVSDVLFKNYHSVIMILIKKINDLNHRLDKIMHDEDVKGLTKKHNTYFDLFYESKEIDLLLIDFKIKSRIEELEWELLRDYEGDLLRDYNKLQSMADSLRTKSLDFYDISESRIQIESIKYNNIYSRVVFFFILLQVFLAFFAIELSKWKLWYAQLIELLAKI